MFDINHGTAPQYLSELVRRCDDTRLRSSVHGNFIIPHARLHVTDKAFFVAVPLAWNRLHDDDDDDDDDVCDLNKSVFPLPSSRMTAF